MKNVLGRGLDSLIPVPDEEQGALNGVVEIDINLIDPNKNQPRKMFSEGALKELTESIALHGVVQPLLVQAVEDRYKIIAGERRWRAARMAGVKTLPVVVRNYSPQQLIEVSLIENIQREDLNPVEEANAYNALMLEFGLTQEALSDRVGKSRSAIANSLRLLSLPEPILNLLSEQALTAGHARALIGVPEAPVQMRIAEQIMKNGLSVRETERMIATLKTETGRKIKKEIPGELVELEDDMKKFFGTRVKIRGSINRGKIEIEYFTRNDMERIFEIINGKA